MSNKDYMSAANQFRQATALKPDYANAHYNFANALIQLQDYANAKTELETTKSLIPADSNDAQSLDTAIADVNAKLQAVAGAATQKPTVDQISGTNGAATQAPLTNAGAQDTKLNTDTLPANK